MDRVPKRYPVTRLLEDERAARALVLRWRARRKRNELVIDTSDSVEQWRVFLEKVEDLATRADAIDFLEPPWMAITSPLRRHPPPDPLPRRWSTGKRVEPVERLDDKS